MPEIKKMYAVVCTMLHNATGPYTNRLLAQSVSDEMNFNNETKEASDLNPNHRYCRFVVVDFYVSVGTPEEVSDSKEMVSEGRNRYFETKKERMH